MSYSTYTAPLLPSIGIGLSHTGNLTILNSKAFKPIHPPGTLAMLPPGAHIGCIDPATVPKDLTGPSEEDIRIAEARATLPPPSAVLNLAEMEELAKGVLTSTAWGYYRSAGDDENS